MPSQWLSAALRCPCPECRPNDPMHELQGLLDQLWLVLRQQLVLQREERTLASAKHHILTQLRTLTQPTVLSTSNDPSLTPLCPSCRVGPADL
jgi:hypothetical protein